MSINIGRSTRYRTTAIFRISIDMAVASAIYLVSMVSWYRCSIALSSDDRKQNTIANTFRGGIKAIVSRIINRLCQSFRYPFNRIGNYVVASIIAAHLSLVSASSLPITVSLNFNLTGKKEK